MKYLTKYLTARSCSIFEVRILTFHDFGELYLAKGGVNSYLACPKLFWIVLRFR